MILRILIILGFLMACPGPLKLSLAAEAVKKDQPESIGIRKVEYKADELRDPFLNPLTDRSQGDQANPGGLPVIIDKTLPDLKIQGVIWGGGVPMAIINNKIVKVGDIIEECRILEITKNGINVFFINNKYILPLPGALKGGTDEMLN